MRLRLFVSLLDELADPAIVARLSAEAEHAGWHGLVVWKPMESLDMGARRGAL